jgi:hypothetical protein
VINRFIASYWEELVGAVATGVLSLALLAVGVPIAVCLALVAVVIVGLSLRLPLQMMQKGLHRAGHAPADEDNAAMQSHARGPSALSS